MTETKKSQRIIFVIGLPSIGYFLSDKLSYHCNIIDFPFSIWWMRPDPAMPS